MAQPGYLQSLNNINQPHVRKFVKQFMDEDIDEFHANVAVELLDKKSPYTDASLQSLTSNFGIWQFNEHGRKVFRIAPNLTERLKNTTLKDVTCDLVKLPFKCIMLYFGTDVDTFVVNDNLMCEYVILHLSGGKLTMEFISRWPPGRYPAAQTLAPVLQNGVGLRKVLHDDIYNEWKPPAEVLANPSPVWRTLESAARESALKKKSVDAGFNLVFNAILYINSFGAELSQPEEGYSTRQLKAFPLRGGKWREQQMRYSVKEVVTVDVGKSTPRPIEYAEGTGAKLGVRYQVRGHGRWQVCGPRNSLRKHIWIDDFWKGPALAPIKQRSYKVIDSTLKKYEVARV